MMLSAPRTFSSYGFGDTFLFLQERANSVHLRVAKSRALAAIHQISQRPENWDGCGSDRPSEAACSRAATEVSSFIDAAFAENLGWLHPHVSSNEYGEVSFEWWRGEKRLTVYVGADTMHFVCSWGADINGTMDAGVLYGETFVQKWRWFRV